MENLFNDKLKEAISSLFPHVSVGQIEVGIPTDLSRADYVSNIAFVLAKELKEKPYTIASKICDFLNKDDKEEIAAFSAAEPGFINITLGDRYLTDAINQIIRNGSKYGTSNKYFGEKWVVEHTSPNPNKAMHIGHLRNNLVGIAISNILEANGATVVCDAVDNDRGIAIAKAMWGYLVFKRKDGKKISDPSYWLDHQNEWFTPEELKQKSDHFVGDCYGLGADDFKNNPESEKLVRDMVVQWENGDKTIWALWARVLQYAHEGINETLKRIGNRWDKVWYEHEHYKQGKDLISEGLKKNIFTVTENGAVLSNLAAYKLPDTIVLKSDGTALYITQDIALTKLKKETYGADKLVWVIGAEQSLAMKQLFAICEQLGIGKVTDFFHVAYGLVNVKDSEGKTQKMSSRSGQVVLIDELIDSVKAKLISQERGYSDDQAEKITMAAIKFMILRHGRTTDMTFDEEASLRFDGDSGVYVLYTYARTQSLLKKGNLSASLESVKLSAAERKLARHLCYLPIIIRNSVQDFSPQLIAEYVLQLSQIFNSLYASEIFIGTDLEETNKKLHLAKATATAIHNAVRLLGIETLKKI